MLNAALDGDLDNAEYREDEVFGLMVPTAIEDVPTEILTPRETWDDKEAFDAQAKRVAGMFRDNFIQYAEGMDNAVVDSGPRG
jgi:phosphoenolpyruvate carboxykinase (ATP)